MFFDSLIRCLAVEINIGSTELNRDLELPSYRSVYSEGESLGSHVEKRGWNTPREMLSSKILDAIDDMLKEARRQGLECCCDKIKISQFLWEHTDLNSCHTVALNEMHLTTFHKNVASLC